MEMGQQEGEEEEVKQLAVEGKGFVAVLWMEVMAGITTTTSS